MCNVEKAMRNNLTQKYSRGTIIIHWLSALLIIILFPLGKYMAGLEPMNKMGLIKIHAGLGILVLVLTVIRSWLFFKALRPADIATGSRINDKLVVWVHNAFYFILFGIAISGVAVMILGGYGDALQNNNSGLILSRDQIAPLKGHGLLALILMVLLLMHVVGVVKHYLATRENTLRRIF